jgi:type IV pilus assembly protein PilM
MKMPSSPSLKMPTVPNIKLGRRTAPDLVGLDIQPGFVAAVKARVNGSILVERAAALPLDADIVREGEVVDEGALSEVLRELFAENRLSKRVRVGIANQRTVMRMLELPPVTDRKELAAAVRFQAQDQLPMPLNSAVLDFHPLGVFDTPAGPRQRVVLVAAQRDMVQKLLGALRGAGLTPEGVDLSAFALIRSLYHRGEDEDGRVLYLNVDGLTNLAIADGTTCRFTRVVGGGLESMAGEIAERRGIPVAQARTLLYEVDLTRDADDLTGFGSADAESEAPTEIQPTVGAQPPVAQQSDDAEPAGADAQPQDHPALSPEDHEAQEIAMGYSETIAAAAQAGAPESEPPAVQSGADIRAVVENGVREVSGEVRNSLDFYRSQEEGGQVSHVVLSGSALDLKGFAEALQASLGFEVRSDSTGLADPSLAGKVSTSRLSVAAGLASTEAPR